MLKPTRKADRKEMARQLADLGPHTLTAEGSDQFYDRCFRIVIHAEHGLNASISVDGDSRNCRNEAYVINWYMDSKATGRLSSLFEARMGSVNRYHRAKATTVVYGFNNVIDVMETGLAMCADRSAFESESIHA